jgi:hypothetical protein
LEATRPDFKEDNAHVVIVAPARPDRSPDEIGVVAFPHFHLASCEHHGQPEEKVIPNQNDCEEKNEKMCTAILGQAADYGGS